jgi:hypothetical protein
VTKLAAEKVTGDDGRSTLRFPMSDLNKLQKSMQQVLLEDHVIFFGIYSTTANESRISACCYRYITVYTSDESLPLKDICAFVMAIVDQIKFITEKPFHPQVELVLKELRPLAPIEHKEMMIFFKKIKQKRFCIEFVDDHSTNVYLDLYKEFGTEGMAKLHRDF